MKKQIISAFLLSAVIMSSLLVSCGSPSDDDLSTDSSEAVTDTSVAETGEPSEYVKPETDYNGREFIFCSWITDSTGSIALTYAETGSDSLNGDIINDAIYERNAKIEEELGVKIKPLNYRDTHEVINPSLAGDHFADTMIILGQSIPQILNQDIALDLMTIPTLDLERSWWEESAIEECTLGNRLYFASGHISAFGQLGIFVTYFNKDMVNQFDLESPYQLVRDGEWTFDKMVEMCTAVSSDLNGDGVMNAEDRYGMASSPYMEPYVLYASGERITKKDSDGMPVLTLQTDRAAGVVEKLVALYRDKSLCMYSEDFASEYTNVFFELLIPMFRSGNMLFQHQWLRIALDLRNMESDFGIVPVTKYDESQDRYYAPSSSSYTRFAMVPITVDDLNFVGDIMNALGYYGREYVNEALIETTITGKSIRDTETEEMLELIYNSRSYDLALFYNWGNVVNRLSGFIFSNITTYASTVASIEEQVTTAIGETMTKYLG